MTEDLAHTHMTLSEALLFSLRLMAVEVDI